MSVRVEDRLEIHDLLSRWCVAIDDGDLDGWADVFTPDGVFELVTHPLRLEGRDALRDLAEKVYATDQGMQRHVCLNILLEEDGDAIRSRSDFQVLELRTGGDARIIKTGRYHDRIVRHDGRWAIAERQITWDTPHIPEQPDVEGVEPLLQ